MLSIAFLIAFYFPEEKYIFLPMRFKEVVVTFDDFKSHQVTSGYISEDGTYMQEKVIVKSEKRLNLAGIRSLSKRSDAPRRMIDPDPKKLIGLDTINISRWRNEEVYEYRSGKLILGYFNAYTFVPESGEKVIDFKEYIYSETSKRIYNLPGKFVKESEAEAERKKIAEQERDHRKGK